MPLTDIRDFTLPGEFTNFIQPFEAYLAFGTETILIFLIKLLDLK